MDTKIKNIIPFISFPLKMKYLGINLAPHVQDLYAGNYKMLVKEIKILSEWRDILCSQIGNLNVVMILILLNRYVI